MLRSVVIGWRVHYLHSLIANTILLLAMERCDWSKRTWTYTPVLRILYFYKPWSAVIGRREHELTLLYCGHYIFICHGALWLVEGCMYSHSRIAETILLYATEQRHMSKSSWTYNLVLQTLYFYMTWSAVIGRRVLELTLSLSNIRLSYALWGWLIEGYRGSRGVAM